MLEVKTPESSESKKDKDPEIRNGSSRSTLDDIEQFESDLWEAADNLRANSKLTSSDYFMPVLGVIFLRHATNRFNLAKSQIEADQAQGKMPKRKVLPADYIARRALYLPENAHYDWIMQQASSGGVDLPKLITAAMTAIEESFEPLRGVLPKDYGIFETKVLEDLLRLFNSELIKNASGDVFGRIYEYFLAKFSIQKAHDNGEFFTPSSIVETIVNVIEPNHGTILDPACGSGGMFVQSSHFIENQGDDTAKKVVFYGQEKNRDTIRIAKMNLAVHGLEGKIAEAITYYEDEHSLLGKCDFVMANPPFNVDLVDAKRVEGDPRLPFGLPGINKDKKVSNGNYLWISYFWSYLNEKGRAGFVMSSQASSAAHGEKEVRRKIVETGDVDVMISIRSNFFYTRSVPCELWFFDRGKPADRKNTILMLDARSIYRKVTRKINDFSPEQTQNLAAIIWLHRGQQQRFLNLVKDYLGYVCSESSLVPPRLQAFESTLDEIRSSVDKLISSPSESTRDEKSKTLLDVADELQESWTLYRRDATNTLRNLDSFTLHYANALPIQNGSQHDARRAFEPHADAMRGLAKQIDLLYKLANRAVDSAAELAGDSVSGIYEGRRAAGRLIKQLDIHRSEAVDQLKRTVYFHKQILWLQERFPAAEMRAVPGLVKLVDRADVEAADWSLTPGRYVGMTPQEDDEDFDFEKVLQDIHTELTDLDKEATGLATKIQQTFKEMGL